MAELDKTISVIESWLKQPVLTPPPINELYDALELLKEQEAEKPIVKEIDVKPFHKCIGNEYTLIEDSGFNYCPYCGKKVFWE